MFYKLSVANSRTHSPNFFDLVIHFPADRTVFAFFGEGLMAKCSVSTIFDVYQWIHVAWTVTKRRSGHGLTVALVIRSKHRLVWGTWVCLVKNRSATMLKFIDWIFERSSWNQKSPYVQHLSVFDSTARFPYQKQQTNHRPVLLFFHFSNGHDLLLTWPDEFDSVENLKVVVDENVNSVKKSRL